MAICRYYRQSYII